MGNRKKLVERVHRSPTTLCSLPSPPFSNNLPPLFSPPFLLSFFPHIFLPSLTVIPSPHLCLVPSPSNPFLSLFSLSHSFYYFDSLFFSSFLPHTYCHFLSFSCLTPSFILIFSFCSHPLLFISFLVPISYLDPAYCWLVPGSQSLSAVSGRDLMACPPTSPISAFWPVCLQTVCPAPSLEPTLTCCAQEVRGWHLVLVAARGSPSLCITSRGLPDSDVSAANPTGPTRVCKDGGRGDFAPGQSLHLQLLCTGPY